MEKYITFSVPIEKEHGSGKTATYKAKFIDSFRFMPSSSTDLVDNLLGILKIDCIIGKERKKTKSVSKLIGLKNNKIKVRMQRMQKTSLNLILTYKLIKISQVYINFVMVTLINLFCC